MMGVLELWIEGNVMMRKKRNEEGRNEEKNTKLQVRYTEGRKETSPPASI